MDTTPQPDTLAERIARGSSQNSTDDDAIVPFPLGMDFDDLLPTLTGHSRAWLGSHLNDGFILTPYVYRSADSLPILVILRLDHETKGKVIRPLRCERVVGIVARASFRTLAPPRPLFNLDRLVARPELPVLLVEGEKTAVAAQHRFPEYVAATWPGGAKSVLKTILAPLAGRDITIWPDNDLDGRLAAQTLAAAAMKAGTRSTRVVQIPASFPPKWDLADAPQPIRG